jgi:hypothetical protein
MRNQVNGRDPDLAGRIDMELGVHLVQYQVRRRGRYQRGDGECCNEPLGTDAGSFIRTRGTRVASMLLCCTCLTLLVVSGKSGPACLYRRQIKLKPREAGPMQLRAAQPGHQFASTSRPEGLCDTGLSR